MDKHGAAGTLLRIIPYGWEIRSNAYSLFPIAGWRWWLPLPIGTVGVLLAVFSNPLFWLYDRIAGLNK
jgi:hypothetical protein